MFCLVVYLPQNSFVSPIFSPNFWMLFTICLVHFKLQECVCNLWAIKWDKLTAHLKGALWSNWVWLEHIQSAHGRMWQVYRKPNAPKINFDILLIFPKHADIYLYDNVGPTYNGFWVNCTITQWVSCLSQLSHYWSFLAYEAITLLYEASCMSSSCHPIFITYLVSIWRLLA